MSFCGRDLSWLDLIAVANSGYVERPTCSASRDTTDQIPLCMRRFGKICKCKRLLSIPGRWTLIPFLWLSIFWRATQPNTSNQASLKYAKRQHAHKIQALKEQKVSVVLLVYVKDLISNTFLFIPRYHLTDHLAQELDCRQQWRRCSSLPDYCWWGALSCRWAQTPHTLKIPSFLLPQVQSSWSRLRAWDFGVPQCTCLDERPLPGWRSRHQCLPRQRPQRQDPCWKEGPWWQWTPWRGCHHQYT